MPRGRTTTSIVLSSVMDCPVVPVETEDGFTLSLDKGRLMVAMIPESVGASGRIVDTDAHIG